MKPVQTQIEADLQQHFAPAVLQVENESHMHSVPPNSETHFKITLVSEAFAGKRPVQRHQAVYAVLAEQMAGPVHALALHTFTPEEWQNAQVPDSPNCLGGGGK
ncbi:BolA/IbaG family iron-sulfur metabolism protein [Gilvimarinus agarilyticus]|uniref:BolA family protein n=1 Tax=Gilvimarinus sp. 2_MG-2023 TaxID=3062666 RepID=UPI001C0A3C7A|nr:BolA/IbaG family iron-sulfur metabolism protein [Gilvimarinus sp. 2_MG-2023]MBU2884698.1 BolA/IbaG family iron-sulfur metabolism protein [Gilvimarinus agarilyticus]MDO6569806.1 BolA/IbaG family iron-sulfur metabolism protein [Gilvimarinus sp. 2_MG-2023]